MNRAVIDTNVLISWYKAGFINTNKTDLDSTAPIFSIITKIEALGIQNIANEEIKSIENMLNTGELIYIDHDIVKQTIELRQSHKIKTPDAIIAATALLNNAELWTANTSDFSSIKGLRLHNPL